MHGIVTSDRWSAYGHLDVRRRQLCWAHLYRDLQGLVDVASDDEELAALFAGMKRMFRDWQDFKSGELDRGELQAAVAPYRETLRAWAFREADAAVKGKRRGLARGLKKAWPAVFQFIDVDSIEPTNNQAERALRPAVLWRKGSFGTRSDAGSRFVERILTVWATCRQQIQSRRIKLIPRIRNVLYRPSRALHRRLPRFARPLDSGLPAFEGEHPAGAS